VEPTALIGTWRFERAIRGRVADVPASGGYEVLGTADFTPLPDGRIRWAEHGTLSWVGGSAPVERTLFLAPKPAPASWMVTFADGRDFHPWQVGAVSHWCAPDSYDGVVATEAAATDAWTLSWTVTGPHKDYTMTTEYRRATAIS
jgi:hypothetical protein